MRNLPQRLVEGAVVLLATYTLVSVPIGKKTGLEHLKAIFTSGPAKQAAADMKATVEAMLKPKEKPSRRAEADDDERQTDEGAGARGKGKPRRRAER